MHKTPLAHPPRSNAFFNICLKRGMKGSDKKAKGIITQSLAKGLEKKMNPPLNLYQLGNEAKVGGSGFGHLAAKVSSTSTPDLNKLNKDLKIARQAWFDCSDATQWQNDRYIINQKGEGEDLLENYKNIEKEVGKLSYRVETGFITPCALMFQLTSSKIVNPADDTNVTIAPLMPVLFHVATVGKKVQESRVFVKLIMPDNPAVEVATEDTISRVLAKSGITSLEGRAGFVLKILVFAVSQWSKEPVVMVQGLGMCMNKANSEKIDSLGTKSSYNLLYNTTTIGAIGRQIEEALITKCEHLEDKVNKATVKAQNDKSDIKPKPLLNKNFFWILWGGQKITKLLSRRCWRTVRHRV